jgi:hypothetical protein
MAVIIQAVVDIRGPKKKAASRVSDKNARDIARDQALAWVSADSPVSAGDPMSFRSLCDTLDIDPVSLRSRILSGGRVRVYNYGVSTDGRPPKKTK